ncbi:hypothetical protein P7C71_g6223, partial [Lecanoromycetidae sp. Uapishka_2]
MPPSPSPPPSWTTYRIGRGEQGVLTFEPYKSALLPLWRFKTPEIATKSSQELWSKFLQYEVDDDFVGMDMARKFLQMGMTRAKRYANHKGGKKYGVGGKAKGQMIEVPKEDWEGRKEKEEASAIFREVWERAKAWEGYLEMKEEFLRKQKGWDQEQSKGHRAENWKRKRKREDVVIT